MPHDLEPQNLDAPALDANDRERVENLLADLEELRSHAEGSLPAPDVDRQTLERMVLAGSAYARQPRRFLAECGWELPAPDSLDDEQQPAQLWRSIWALALLRLLIDHTDHLSDRELYETIYHDIAMEPSTLQPGEETASVYAIDLAPAHDPEGRELLLTYYRDRLDADEIKALEAAYDGPLPAPRPRPADRDRFLP